MEAVELTVTQLNTADLEFTRSSLGNIVISQGEFDSGAIVIELDTIPNLINALKKVAGIE